MRDRHDRVRDAGIPVRSFGIAGPAPRRRQVFGRVGVLVAAFELLLLRSVVDIEVWVRLGGHGIDHHVLFVVVGLAVAGILVSGVVTVALVRVDRVGARLRAVLVLAAQAGLRYTETRRRRRRRDAVVPRGRSVLRPAGATGPRAPGVSIRRPS